MENLPVEISSDIFSRLLTDTVLQCQRVCKTWRNLLLSLDKPNFAAMHMHMQLALNNGGGSKVSLGFVFLVKSVTQKTTSHPLYYGEFNMDIITDQHEWGTRNPLRLINHPLLRTRRKHSTRSLVSSCNGLICFAEPTESGLGDPIHICNSITRECLYLKGLDENEYHYYVSIIYSGFGYIPQTNEYKVVRILYRNLTGSGDIQVCTLGDGGGWRNKGVLTITTSDFSEVSGVFFNGSLHWLLYSNKKIMVFDLKDETFHVLPLPAPRETDCILESYGDWLCVSSLRTISYSKRCLDIWTLRKISALDDTVDSWSWCKDCSITLETSSPWRYRPFALTKSGLILLKYKYPDGRRTPARYPNAQKLLCYNPKTARMEILGIWRFLEVIPHTNSFVSLKALGETTSKKRKNRSSLSTSGRLASLDPNPRKTINLLH